MDILKFPFRIEMRQNQPVSFILTDRETKKFAFKNARKMLF